MSLFLGNLSSRVRREELERVFQRFGRSDLHLKDGYGFVIYDIAANAERALRALRGKDICGEQISITWANKQPRPFRRFTRNTRFSQPYRGRNFKREEDGGFRSRGYEGEIELTNYAKHQEDNHEGPDGFDLLDKEGFDLDDIEDGREKGQNSKEGVMDEPKQPLENDRWGEPNADSLNDHGVENETEFDRYEPYRGYDGRNENENHQKTSSYGSPANTSSTERARRERSGDATWKYTGNLTNQQTCYICGLIGHIRRNCPRAEALRREKFSRFDRRQDSGLSLKGRSKRGRIRPGSTSWTRCNLNRDHLLAKTRKRVSDRRTSGSGKPNRSDKRNRSKSPSSAKIHHSSLRKRSRPYKRDRKKPEAPKKHQKKKARKSGSLPSNSNSTSSSSWLLSTPSKSLSRASYRSRSRSVSSRSCSFSSTSRSASSSSYSKSWSSRSGSRSSRKSTPLTVPLVQDLPGTSTKYTSEDGIKLRPMHSLPEQGQLEVDAGAERLGRKETFPTLEDENKLFSCEIDDEEKSVVPGLGNGDDNRATCGTQYEEKSFGIAPAEKRHFMDSNRNLQKTDSAVRELKEVPISNLNLDIPVYCHASNPLSISSEEILAALKHYELPMPKESELRLSVDAYFGAARLWPWEMVYYRRLKKGPISTENYAKRVSQNREFGIVDKYVRNSSGWFECDYSEV